MSRRSRRLTSQLVEEPVVNLTPLIDVVFVILIMFILIAPILELDRIELADATEESAKGSIAVQENSPITIHVHRNNTIAMNDKTVTIDQLPALLRQARKKYPKVRPQIYHDKRAHFGVYQSIKNAVEDAGYQQMDIILKPA